MFFHFRSAAVTRKNCNLALIFVSMVGQRVFLKNPAKCTVKRTCTFWGSFETQKYPLFAKKGDFLGSMALKSFTYFRVFLTSARSIWRFWPFLHFFVHFFNTLGYMALKFFYFCQKRVIF
jgi:hypothetical protein